MKNNTSEANITVMYIVDLLISNFKKIILGMLLFSLVGYAFFKVENQVFYNVKNVIHVGFEKTIDEIGKVTPIESQESLEKFLKINFIELPQLAGKQTLLESFTNQQMNDGSFLSILVTKNASEEIALSSMESILNALIKHHSELRELKNIKIQNDIEYNKKKLVDSKKKIILLKETLALLNTSETSLSKNIKIEETNILNLLFALQESMENRTKNFTEITLTDMEYEVERLEKLIVQDSKKSSSPNFENTKLFSGFKTQVVQSSSHSLMFNLITFTLLGFILSSGAVLFRGYYTIYKSSKEAC